MNRNQAEKLIIGLMKQIVEIYHLYDPDGDYLSLSYLKKGDESYVNVDNCAHTAHCPVDYHERY